MTTNGADGAVLVHAIDVSAGAEAVFRAVAHPDGIVEVFPFSSVTSDLRAGGAIVLAGEGPDGPFVDHGVIHAFEPPALFEYAYWSTNHGRPDTADNRVWIRYRVTPAGAGVRLVAAQGNLPSQAYAEMMRLAWPALLAGPKARLERDAPA